MCQEFPYEQSNIACEFVLISLSLFQFGLEMLVQLRDVLADES